MALDDAERCLDRVGWQPTIFAETLRRRDLLRLEPTWPRRPAHLHVLRNQPFEFVASALTTFGSYAGWDIEVTIGEYDDSLVDVGVKGADAVAVWLDYRRYAGEPAEVAAWLAGRIRALREESDAPVVVHDEPDDAHLSGALRTALAGLAGVDVVPQAEIAAGLGGKYRDGRAARITGFDLSDAACLATARQLGLRWLPAALGNSVRAVIVDLDGTLYDGVLGEDGPEGLHLSPGHVAMGGELLAHRDQGIFLGYLSRNEPEDVAALFAARTDLLVRPEHFSVASASWEPKAERLRRIIGDLRIGADAVLVVDDNPGELASLATELPGLHGLWANPADPDTTARALHWYPGLARLRSGREDDLRVADLAAAARRETDHRAAADPDAYMRSLGLVVTLAVDPTDLIPRLHELSVKTNQFNTTLLRLSEGDLARRIADPCSRVVAASLADRLSDSGNVLSLVVRRDQNALVVEELAMSCRALGRGIETPLILIALRRLIAELGGDHVVFPFVVGPRNDPARRWLTGLPGARLGDDVATMAWDRTAVDELIAGAPLTVTWAEAA